MSNPEETTGADFNLKRFLALRAEFVKGIGKKAFFLTSQFPFIFIGVIQAVVEDYIVVKVETTQIQQLEDRIWQIHMDTINVFYIEREGGPKIPELSK